MLSFVNANLVGGGPASFPIVLGLAIAFGGIAQLLAGMWEFRTGNTFGAVAFSSYGAFWISFFFLVSFNVAQLPKTEIDSAARPVPLGVGDLHRDAVPLHVRLAARAAAAVPAADVTFILLGIGNSGGTPSMIHAGGYFGIATGAVALYIACADIMQAVYKRVGAACGLIKRERSTTTRSRGTAPDHTGRARPAC